MRIARFTGGAAEVEEAALQAFKGTLRGEMFRPGDDAYDQTRRIWNGMIDRKPGMIVRCAGAADVVSAVNFARDNSLLVSVRGGGHSAAGNAVCDGGLMIDLSRMRSIRVDTKRRTARAEGGAKWIDFDRETQAFGLATTGGTNSDTGIAGLTLGGGIGWLAGKYGLACDNLLSIDIVTADGQLRTASADEHADLFWAVRGGGGNFGVATSFEYQLHPVGPALLAGMVLYPFQKAKAVLKFYRDFSGAIPDEVNTVGALLTSPEGQPAVAIAACYAGPVEDGEQALRPLKQFGPPMADLIQPMPYLALQSMLDAAAPPGRQYYWKGVLFQDISEEVMDILVDYFSDVPSPYTIFAFQQLGNAANRVPPDATAFSNRHARYDSVVLSAWENPSDTERNIEWTRKVYAGLKPYSTGATYVNTLGFAEDAAEGRVKDAYRPDTYQRLAALKKTYDPANLFRLNVNITPLA